MKNDSIQSTDFFIRLSLSYVSHHLFITVHVVVIVSSVLLLHIDFARLDDVEMRHRLTVIDHWK